MKKQRVTRGRPPSASDRKRAIADGTRPGAGAANRIGADTNTVPPAVSTEPSFPDGTQNFMGPKSVDGTPISTAGGYNPGVLGTPQVGAQPVDGSMPPLPVYGSRPADDDAVAFIRVIGEELVNAGFPAGDRSSILVNVRNALSELRFLRPEMPSGDTVDLPNFPDLQQRLDLVTVASCSCNLQEDHADPQYHRTTCRYRLLREAAAAIRFLRGML